MVSIRSTKWKYVKGFFTKEELNFLQPYVHKKGTSGQGDLNNIQTALAPSFYSDDVMDTFLEMKLPLMEKETNLKLFKTYAYWRYYIWGSELPDHTDRKACEISVTANIDSCGRGWPIHMNEEWINIHVGDAVIYLGCEVNHGRKKFEGDFCAQVFMHYVDRYGPNAIQANDDAPNDLKY